MFLFFKNFFKKNIANGRLKRNTDDYDNDLNPVLEKASNEQLQPLVDILTGAFSNFLEIEEAYKKHNPNHVMYADLIASELRSFGGNSFANMARAMKHSSSPVVSVGPAYREIVCDVAKQLKVNFNSSSKAERIEQAILDKVLENALNETSDEELKIILKELTPNKKFPFTRSAAVLAIMKIFRAGGFKSYQLALIIVNAVFKKIMGRGLSLAANAALTKSLSILTGPIGTVITTLWLVIDIAGPATRVTIPSVVYIAALRMQM